MKNYIIIAIIIFFYSQSYAQSNKFVMAKIAFDNKNYEKAEILVDDYCQKYENDKKAIFLRSNIKLELKKYEKALANLSKLKPNFAPNILLLKARANAGLNNNDLAIKQLDEYLSSRKKEPEPIIMSYPEFAKLKKTEEWTQIWKNERYSRKEQSLNNVFYALKTKKYAEANDRLDEFLSKYKTHSYAHYLKSKLLYKDKKYREALKHAEQSVEKDDKSIEYKQLKAKCLTKLKKTRKAIALFNVIIAKDSVYLQAYKGRAEAYMNSNEHEKAENDIAKYRKYYPDEIEAKLLNAKINDKGGDYLGAIKNYGQLIKENPAEAEYFIGRADAYLKTKTYKYALRDYSMALDINPKKIYAYKQKALIYKQLGNTKKACSEWKYAAQMGDMKSIDNLKKYCGGVGN